MRLTELELANFKVFAESTKIPIRPITLIFGPNSSGKSSILQSLLLMKQSATTEFTEGNLLQFRGSLVDLGSYHETVNGRDPSKSISLGVTFDLSDETKALEDFSSMTGLRIENPRVSVKTNFVSEQPWREGLGSGTVRSIEATFDDEKLILDAVNDSAVATISTNEQEVHFSKKRFSPIRMRISELLTEPFLYQEILKPLLAKSIEGLTEKLEELRKKFDAAPDEDPRPEEVNQRRPRFRKVTKPYFAKEIHSHERLLSVLSEYDYESFKKDLQLANEKIFIGLRGCILDRSQVVDRNSDILYPSFEHTSSANFYVEKFKELLSDEFLVNDMYIEGEDNPFREFRDVYTEKYYLLTHIWQLDYILVSSEIYRKFLHQLLYIGPMRQFPSRYYLPESVAGDSVGKRGELSPTLLLQRPNLISDVNSWLDRLNVGYELDISRLVNKESAFDEGIFALMIRKKGMGMASSLLDVGFGISQLLPVVLQSIVSEKSTLCIEQPELHLHPALQAELGDLFIEAALGERKNTLILETHSEHIMLRLMRRMRDTCNGTLPPWLPPIRPQDIAVLYVQPGESSTTVRILELDNEGQLLDPFPGGFFEEGFRERFS